MKPCAYCGRENEDQAALCPECGTTGFVLPQPRQPSSPPRSIYAPSGISVDFIRIFFKSPVEEEFAVECAEFIARVVGERVLQLRPNTKWSEILQWLGPTPKHQAVFALLLRLKFRKDVDEFIAAAGATTFREYVEYVCRHEHSATAA